MFNREKNIGMVDWRNERVIELENISKIYGTEKNKTEALNNINLKINKGEMVSIMGTSGCGKTSLLNIIGLIDRESGGKYYFEGENLCDIGNRKREEHRNTHISFVFQNFALMEDYTVFENVEMPLINRKIQKKQRRLMVHKVLEQMGLLDIKEKYPKKISGGQQQRCAIARALVTGNKIMLADEPTGALDEKNSEEIMKIFRKINNEGTTIIIVTHDIKIANKTDRIIELIDGKIVKDYCVK